MRFWSCRAGPCFGGGEEEEEVEGEMLVRREVFFGGEVGTGEKRERSMETGWGGNRRKRISIRK